MQRIEMAARIDPDPQLELAEARRRWLALGNRIVEDHDDHWIGAVSHTALIGLTPADDQPLASFIAEVESHGERIERIDYGRNEVVIRREDGSTVVDWIGD